MSPRHIDIAVNCDVAVAKDQPLLFVHTLLVFRFIQLYTFTTAASVAVAWILAVAVAVAMA